MTDITSIPTTLHGYVNINSVATPATLTIPNHCQIFAHPNIHATYSYIVAIEVHQNHKIIYHTVSLSLRPLLPALSTLQKNLLTNMIVICKLTNQVIEPVQSPSTIACMAANTRNTCNIGQQQSINSNQCKQAHCQLPKLHSLHYPSSNKAPCLITN